MAEYTKGEWKQEGRLIVAYGEDGAVICEMVEPRPQSGLAEAKRLELNSPFWNLAMSNANLIAAAPLGDELAMAVSYADFDDYDDFLELKELANKFRAKAEGR